MRGFFKDLLVVSAIVGGIGGMLIALPFLGMATLGLMYLITLALPISDVIAFAATTALIIPLNLALFHGISCCFGRPLFKR